MLGPSLFQRLGGPWRVDDCDVCRPYLLHIEKPSSVETKPTHSEGRRDDNEVIVQFFFSPFWRRVEGALKTYIPILNLYCNSVSKGSTMLRQDAVAAVWLLQARVGRVAITASD